MGHGPLSYPMAAIFCAFQQAGYDSDCERPSAPVLTVRGSLLRDGIFCNVPIIESALCVHKKPLLSQAKFSGC